VQVDFYQLTRDPAEKVLPPIAQRVLDGGGRLLVVADSAKEGEGDDSIQPILLSSKPVAANLAKFIVLADGVWRDEALEFERAFFLFPPDSTDNARAAWRALNDQEGAERRYWKQDGGKWVQGP
jgi:DNA polymerase III subunit chi